MTSVYNRSQLRDQVKELQLLARSQSDQTPYEQQLHQTIVVMARQIDQLSRDLYLLEQRYQSLLQKKPARPSEPERSPFRPRGMDYWYEQAKSYEDVTPQELEQHLQIERVAYDQVSLDDEDRERAQYYQDLSAEERARARRYQAGQASNVHPKANSIRYVSLMLLVLIVMLFYFMAIILLG